MIRKLKTGEYRIYSLKKNPKTGSGEILEHSQRARLRKNTKEKFNTSKTMTYRIRGRSKYRNNILLPMMTCVGSKL